MWREKDVPTASYATIFNDPRYRTVDERFFTRLNYRHLFENDWEVRAAIYGDLYSYSGDYPFHDESLPAKSNVFRDETDVYWWGAEFQVSKQLFPSHRITLGGEYRDNSDIRLTTYTVDPYLSSLALKTSSRSAGVYLQDEWTIAKNLRLNAGLRYDAFTAFDSTINPRLALIYQPAPQTTLKLLYGEAFRAPNVFESSYANSYYRLNPDLEPEKIPQLRARAGANTGQAPAFQRLGVLHQISSSSRELRSADKCLLRHGRMSDKAELEMKQVQTASRRAVYLKKHETCGEN